MKIKIFLLLFVFFVTACSNTASNDTEKIELKGESESWSVVYNIERKSENGVEAKDSTELKFMNLENEPIGEVEYSFESAAGGLSGRGTVDRDGLLLIDGSHSLNAATPNNINVTLIWNGKTESLILSK